MLDAKTEALVAELQEDWEVDSPREMLECAKINIEQLWKFAPQLVGCPMYALAAVQLRSALAKLED